MAVIPLKSKEIADVTAGLLEGFVKMGGTPEMIYADNEGSMGSTAMEHFSKIKISSILLQEPAHQLQKGLYARSKICCIQGLETTKQNNRQNLFIPYFSLITIRIFIVRRASHLPMLKSPVTILKLKLIWN